MLNNTILNNFNILNNKYFFVLCFYLKKTNTKIYHTLFIGYKFNYLFLNINYLDNFPDLVISLDYKTNAIFLNKISNYNVPVICFTNLLNSNIINNMFYYLMFNNKSLYTNIILIYLIFNNIWSYKKVLGTPILKN